MRSLRTKTCKQCGESFSRTTAVDLETWAAQLHCSRACARAAADAAMPERFWEKVIPEPMSGCWLWMASFGSAGYGQFNLGYDKRGRIKMGRAHRIAWELTRGPIPAGAMLCHKCDNPACCNPDHLFLGDHAANSADMVRKGRSGGQKNPERARRSVAIARAVLAKMVAAREIPPCVHYGRPVRRARHGRCVTCAGYLRRHGVDRPPDLVAAQRPFASTKEAFGVAR